MPSPVCTMQAALFRLTRSHVTHHRAHRPLWERTACPLQAEARRLQMQNVELVAQAAERQQLRSPARPCSRNQLHSPPSAAAGSLGDGSDEVPGGDGGKRSQAREGAPAGLAPGSLDAQLQGLRRCVHAAPPSASNCIRMAA